MPTIQQILQDNLAPNQLNAAIDPGREVLALACAGSGKSRTLAFRIARLIAEGEDPAGIVAFTFTEKAAESIKLRVATALQAAGLAPTILGRMYIGTIHSYCQHVLGEMDARYRQFDVLDENRLKLYLISRYPQLGLQQARQAHNNARYFDVIKEVSNAWKVMNDEMLPLQSVVTGDATLGAILTALSNQLNTDEFIDFSLMIRLTADALRRGDLAARRAVSTLRHLMVDEYQDVNPAQEQLIRELHQLSTTLFVVGDDDQSIYSFRGADVTNILSFQQRYPQCSVHTLSTNYRSTPAIVAAADAFVTAELGPTRIAKNPDAVATIDPRDFRKLWFTTRNDEAEWVAARISDLMNSTFRERDGQVRGLTPADFAILMRSTGEKERNDEPRHRAFTQALERRGIPYTLEAGGSVFDRPQVDVLRSTFELLRTAVPDRTTARQHFDNFVLPAFPQANFDRFVRLMAAWGRLIHTPVGGARRRVYPQQLVHDTLSAFGIEQANFDPGTMQDLGVFSRMIQDVETVYLSIDSVTRYQEVLNFLQNVAESGYDTSTTDVLRRPDTVTVSTVHKMKGLEFPAVFVVDTEAQRFPGRQRSYSGWLPLSVIQPALTRGAYLGTPDAEARLFYTAITRAERYLYVTGTASLPGGTQVRRQSPFWLRLDNPEISQVAVGLPNGLTISPAARRIDETIVPTSYSDIRYYLRCPRDYQLRKSFGFSPAVPELFGFGKTVHTSIEKLHEVFANRPPTPDEAAALADEVFHLKHVFPSGDPINNPGPYERARAKAVEITRDYAEDYSEDFARIRQVEVRFEIPVTKAVISGAIDLLLKEDPPGNILEARVIDFKAIEGGNDPTTSEDLHWTELALQVQLYAKASKDVLGENARTGAVHLLKDNQRIDVPVTSDAIDAAVANVEWAVDRIIAGDFPMRPEAIKCEACDFRAICPKRPENFGTANVPPALFVPDANNPRELARSFSQFDATYRAP